MSLATLLAANVPVSVDIAALSVSALASALAARTWWRARRQTEQLHHTHEAAVDVQGVRASKLLASARQLTSESSEAAIYCALAHHVGRVVPHHEFQLALFSAEQFQGRYSGHGLIDALNATPSVLELHVARSQHLATRVTADDDGLGREVALPIHAGGVLIAVFSLYRTGADFTPAELEDAGVLCAHAGIALEKARALASVVSTTREWESLFHSSADGLALIGTDGGVRRANHALVGMLGHAAPESGHHEGWLAVLPKDRCPVCATIRTGARDQRTVTNASGHTLEISTAPARAGGAVLVVRDVTEARAAEENVRLARQRMFESEKLAAVGRLAAGVSHEVNNPLMGIGGLASVLLEEDTLDPEAREAIEMIQREARRAAKITRDLLQFVRTSDAPIECVDANQLVAEVARIRLQPQQEAGVSLTLALGDPPVLALGSSSALLQVLVNLVTNAEDAMAGEARRELIISTDRIGDLVRIVVDDSGPGVPAEVRAHLFEPFFTTKAPGKGTGLGLSLCQSIIERLGGDIRAEEKPTAGARFVVELPAYDGAAASLPVSRARVA